MKDIGIKVKPLNDNIAAVRYGDTLYHYNRRTDRLAYVLEGDTEIKATWNAENMLIAPLIEAIKAIGRAAFHVPSWRFQPETD